MVYRLGIAPKGRWVGFVFLFFCGELERLFLSAARGCWPGGLAIPGFWCGAVQNLWVGACRRCCLLLLPVLPFCVGAR